MKEIFAPEGYLDLELPEYEHRESQLEMARFIHERLCDSENGIIEAGTGTGKTMAYLIPAIIHALESGKRIAVSTETRALQRQLTEKDIPVARNIFRKYLGSDFKFSLCLGSANYPCRRRFERFLKKGEFDKGDIEHLNRVSALFRERKIFTSHEADVPSYIWGEICRDSELCGQQRCPVSSICPFQAAKREWMQSDVLVMNHYLFFSNIASGKTYLPVTETVIFDEAHSVENIASRQLGFSIDYDLLMSLLQRFHHRGKWGIVNSFTSSETREEAINSIELIAKEANIFFEKVRSLFREGETVKRIKSEITLGVKLLIQMEKFLAILEKCEKDCEDEDFRMEFEPARSRVKGYFESLGSFLSLDLPGYVYWIERSERDLIGNISLTARPVTIDSIMRNEVFTFYESSLFISATLSVKNDFSFFINSTGFERGSGVVLGSPFNYMEQMVIYLGADLPSPEEPRYIEAAAKASAEIIKILGGNCLLLFTSYRMLKSVKNILEDLIDNKIYSQDSMSASKALHSYIRHSGSVLMGTHSFWQGIDLPGDLVKGVIITRLPFAVPDTPIMEARVEKIREEGRNPFVSLQIPDAVLKMKQGAGRLIRRSTDRGIVAVLDSRIKTKGYGATFDSSLPECGRALSLKELTEKYKKIAKISEN
ncbi:MAG TPA: helicase C-terminal domain-containing protein [Spirochaetota bacterium]|nr:helicase C-terminal domain-containing protein [Spirochaetota bacterium]